MSLRSYCSSTSRRSTLSRSIAVPTSTSHGHRRVGLAIADAVDARHRRDDDHVAARQQRERRRVAHPIDLLVHDRVLLDERVGRRDVRLGLVVVVVADEVVDGVVGEQLLELAVELRREDLVVRDDQRRPVDLRDHVRHRERLARAGDAEQDLRLVAAPEAVDELAGSPWADRPRARTATRAGSRAPVFAGRSGGGAGSRVARDLLPIRAHRRHSSPPGPAGSARFPSVR